MIVELFFDGLCLLMLGGVAFLVLGSLWGIFFESYPPKPGL